MSQAAFAHYFPLIPGTKLPAISGWQHAKLNQYARSKHYGISLQPGELVLDFDPRNYPADRNLLDEFLARYPILPTYVVKTPRGGYHVYLTIDPQIRLKKKQEKWPGVDFLTGATASAFVCGPGTETTDGPACGAGQYVCELDKPYSAFKSDWATDFQLADDQSVTAATPGIETLSCEPDFIAMCRTWAPAVEGQHGDIHTYELACKGKDLGLPEDKTYEHMRDIWNPLCNPPWSDDDLWKKVQNAYHYGQSPPGCKTPEAVFANAAPAPAIAAVPTEGAVMLMDDFKDDQIMSRMLPTAPQLDKKGNAVDTLANVANILKHDIAWRGRFKFNQFTSNFEFDRRPPWRADQMNVGLTIEKRDHAPIMLWLSSTQGLEVTEAKLRSAIEAIAEAFHPVRDYLNSLVWDGIPRMDMLTIDTLGAENTVANREIGRILLLAAVKRIFEPGCKQDYVPVLEGPQGIRKGLWIKELGGDWASTSELVRGDKDTYQNLRGRWIVELPEINSTMRKVDHDWIKGVITNPTDFYRPSYGQASVAVPRESIFIATINPSASREYLTDTENRRWLPVFCRTIDIDKLKKNRDQYFAEAVHRYRTGEEAWTKDVEVQKAVKKEQEARREKDPWTEILADWAAAQTNGFVASQLYAAAGFNCSSVASHQRRRLYNVMDELGYEFIRDLGTAGRWRRKEDAS